MRRYKGLRTGLVLICTAMIVRMLVATGTDADASRALTEAKSVMADKPTVWVLHKLPPEPTKKTPTAFTAAEAEKIAIGGKCTYSVDRAALLTAPSPVSLRQAAPQVLILHTHTSEAYTQTAGWQYTETDPLRTDNAEQSVVRVGRELKAALEKQGLSVLHDERVNDAPDYNSAYRHALEKTQAWLEQYPSISVVLDVHRDAIADADGDWISEAVGLNGEKCARVMLVVGTDQGGASHPHWRDNLNFALKVQGAVNRMYPALCKSIDLRTERFNQHVLPGAMLVEIGSAGNTLPEALTAANAFGTALGGYLVSLFSEP